MMHIINYFNPQPNSLDIPSSLRNPFNNTPQKLAIRAAKLLKKRLKSQLSDEHPFFDENQGKMFGVMVVADANNNIAYLSGFSGMLGGKWLVDGFVPPIFKVDKMALLLDKGELQLQKFSLESSSLENNHQRLSLINDLNYFEDASKTELLKLRQIHKNNKQLRDAKRTTLSEHDSTKNVLNELAKQSQFEKQQYKKLKRSIELKSTFFKNELFERFDEKLNDLRQQRKTLSQNLHHKVFNQYQLQNHKGVSKPVSDFFKDKLPPGGTGDCAAPKLIQYALKHELKILALSEFWWGASPKKEVRHHEYFYAPCRSKCHQILPFMLEGLNIENTKEKHVKLTPKIVYEDESIIVLNKPEGMLSIPGKEQDGSVLTWLKEQYPKAEGALLLHRLDQATSGILLAAKNSDVYRLIQQQFIQRTVKKRYIALLSKPLKAEVIINLPLRVDLEDRPRQLVCFEYGKQALTKVKLINHEGRFSRVYFFPKTGRTHQLRVHAAHELGLANPIVGDALYGSKAQRLMLHAEKIKFYHPIKKKTLSFKVGAPF